jgi:hypothetical protein
MDVLAYKPNNPISISAIETKLEFWKFSPRAFIIMKYTNKHAALINNRPTIFLIIYVGSFFSDSSSV